MDSTIALDNLIFRYLERVDAGEGGPEVLEHLVEEHPDQADALQRGVRLLQQTRLHPGPAGDGLPETIGPFRLRRKLGAGGMGVVYLAEQEHPARRVALKLVRPDQLYFEGSRVRFEREIQSVARLSHPAIAAILEIGEHAGVPWFSQELVVGIPLSELLSGLPARSPESIVGADARAVLADYLQSGDEDVPASAWDEEFFKGSWSDVGLRVARQVSEALQHAHERGVLHRDVKPSNVLLTPAGRAVLVDFGLASMRGTTRITQTGAVLGSLHYMPPEQVDGHTDEIGPRTDIYSLGVTLYEFLTLRAPYSSQSVERLRGLILSGGAPDARKINPAVPRDAAIVCATAMDPATARRYESAEAFGADISAVLGHRTIEARPAGAGLRLMRWAQRHPAHAIGAVAAFLLLFVAPIAFGVQRSRAARDLALANANLENALETSQANLESATRAIERVMRWTADEGLDNVPGMLELRIQVIGEALDIFAGLLDTRPADQELLFQQAGLLRTQGSTLADLESRRAADESFGHATAILEPVASAVGAERRWIAELGATQYARALSLYNNGEYERSLPYFRAALENLRRAMRRNPDEIKARRDVGLTAHMVAQALYIVDGLTDEALQLMEEALAATADVLALEPDTLSALTARSAVLRAGARWSMEADDPARAIESYREAVTLTERALELSPGNRDLRWDLVNRLRQLGTLENACNAPDRAEPYLQRALVIVGEIVAENPGVREYEEDRAAVLGAMADTLRKRGDRRGAYEALKSLAEAELAWSLANPDDQELRLNTAVGQINLANFALTDEERGDERIDLVFDHCDRAEAIIAGIRGVGAHRIQGMRMMVSFSRGSACFWRADLAGVERAIEELLALDLLGPRRDDQIAFLWQRCWQLTDDESAREEALHWVEQAVDGGFADLVQFDRSEMVETLGGARIRALRERVAALAAQE